MMSETKDETGWLIEHRHGCTWWDGRSPETFTTDPNDCVRFARNEDGERVLANVIAEHSRVACIVTEHMWCAQSPLVEH